MPKAQRSRACQQCRERRVKCDETPDLCGQCKRLGLQCSGPLQGSVIIDMTDRVMKPRPRKKREVKAPPSARKTSTSTSAKQESPQCKVAVKTEPDAAEHPSTISALPVAVPPNRKPCVDQVQHSELRTEDAIARIQRHYKLPALYQPSKAIPDALDVAFMSHFVKQNNNTRKYHPEIPWITHLPSLSGTATKPAVRLSVRATSMAFFAVVHRDTAILVDSYRWYTTSLHCQRQSLARLGSNMPDPVEIIVPIILTMYEAYAGTTTASVWPHMEAAAKILELRGPENCTGMTSTLFKIMRVSDAHKAIVFNKPSAFAAPEWATLPFKEQAKSAHQELCDIMLRVPETIAMLEVQPGSLRRFFNQPLPMKGNVEPVIARITDYLAFLDRWATSYPYLTKAPEGEILVTTEMANLTSGVNVSNNGELVIPNSFVAFTAASYEALRLILLLLLRKITPNVPRSPVLTSTVYPSPSSVSSPAFISTDDASLLETATAAARAVLEIATYQESTHQIGGFDVLRTVFPLVIVGTLGPRQREKDLAYEMLYRWGQNRGIANLCTAWLNV